MTRVTLVDSGTGNLYSLTEGFRRAGASVGLSRDENELRRAECLVLPGVASFPSIVRGVADVRRELLAAVGDGVPLLGICAGMQVLFESSDEGPGEGLSLLPGSVGALRAPVVPHMGWSPIRSSGDPWFHGITDGAMVYFAHSYAAPADGKAVVATADHGGPFAAAIRAGPIFGVQFHPEKSGQIGASILRNFLGEAGVGQSG